MRLPSRVQFADERTKKAFESLTKDSKEKELFSFLERAFKDIKENAFCGIQIPKRLIPKEYIKKYKINNLWKYNLPNAWRLLYSIEHGEIYVISIILEWMKHPDYEKKFRY